MARLIKSKFRAWLAAKDPDEVVGKGRDCHGCPLANFYCDISGGCEVVIGTNSRTGTMTIDRGHGARPLPDWASRFVHNLDAALHDSDVTADRALEFLDAM